MTSDRLPLSLVHPMTQEQDWSFWILTIHPMTDSSRTSAWPLSDKSAVFKALISPKSYTALPAFTSYRHACQQWSMRRQQLPHGTGLLHGHTHIRHCKVCRMLDSSSSFSMLPHVLCLHRLAEHIADRKCELIESSSDCSRQHPPQHMCAF